MVASSIRHSPLAIRHSPLPLGKRKINDWAPRLSAMRTTKERLSHLLELAAQDAAERAALADEVVDLLLDWPDEYPAAMRASSTSLLEKIVREMDDAAQEAVALRLDGRNDFPLSLLNELFLAAPAGMKDALLARNNAVMAVRGQTVNSETLLEAARNKANF